jgi:hypothetical protein
MIADQVFGLCLSKKLVAAPRLFQLEAAQMLQNGATAMSIALTIGWPAAIPLHSTHLSLHLHLWIPIAFQHARRDVTKTSESRLIARRPQRKKPEILCIQSPK